ncbi:MAG: dephospho-CoA kinase [Gallionellaceae bacterium]
MSHDANLHLLIGLTGGIGSGKSAVANIFETLGVRVIDTDQISQQLTQTNGAAIPAIRDAFGQVFIDASGALDRNKMRERIFANPEEKKRLEAILHPAILAETKHQASTSTSAPYTLIVVPLLFEGQNYQGWLHRTVSVDCSEETQIARTMQRSQLSRAQVEAIMAQQLSRTQRLALTDDVIHNESDLMTLTAQVNQFHQQYLRISAGSD